MNLSEQQNDQKAKEKLKKLGYPVEPNINKNNYDFELRKCLVDNNLFELAEQYGYDKNKQYTEQDVNELTEHINKEIKKTRKIPSQFCFNSIVCKLFPLLIAPICFLLIPIKQQKISENYTFRDFYNYFIIASFAVNSSSEFSFT